MNSDPMPNLSVHDLAQHLGCELTPEICDGLEDPQKSPYYKTLFSTLLNLAYHPTAEEFENIFNCRNFVGLQMLVTTIAQLTCNKQIILRYVFTRFHRRPSNLDRHLQPLATQSAETPSIDLTNQIFTTMYPLLETPSPRLHAPVRTLPPSGTPSLPSPSHTLKL